MAEIASNSEKIFEFFKEICDIPHISFNSGPITDYLVNFASERGLRYVRDGANNVIIYKKATAGYENRPTVILQGHTDMVEAKVPGCDRDMSRFGVEVIYDGDFIKANGTTIYAVGVADADQAFLDKLASKKGAKVDLKDLGSTFKAIASSIATEA